jgi:hypothetical protein
MVFIGGWLLGVGGRRLHDYVGEKPIASGRLIDAVCAAAGRRCEQGRRPAKT